MHSVLTRATIFIMNIIINCKSENATIYNSSAPTLLNEPRTTSSDIAVMLDLQWCYVECVYGISDQTSNICFSTANGSIHNHCNLPTSHNSTHSSLYCVDVTCPEYYSLGSWLMFMPSRLKESLSLESPTTDGTFLIGNSSNRQDAVFRCAIEAIDYNYFGLDDGYYCMSDDNFHSYLRSKYSLASKEIELYTYEKELLGTWTTWLPWSSCGAACGTGSQERWRFCFPDINGVKNCSQTNNFENRTCNTDECPWINGTSYKHLGCREMANYEDLFTEVMEDKHALLDVPKEERLFPAEKCAIVSHYYNRTIFALSGFVCLNSMNESYTYDNYLNATSSYDCRWQSEKSYDIYTLRNDIVDGQWGPWEEGNCNKECDGGNRTDVRYCDNPQIFDGVNCTGVSEKISSCNEQPCLVTVPATTMYAPSLSVEESISHLDSIIVGVNSSWNEEEIMEYIIDVASEVNRIIDLDFAVDWQYADDSQGIRLLALMEWFALDLLTLGNSYYIEEENLDLYVTSHVLNSDLEVKGLQVNPIVYLPPNIFRNMISTDVDFGVITWVVDNIDMWIQPTSNLTALETPNFTVINSKIVTISTYPSLRTVCTDVDVVMKMVRLGHGVEQPELLCSYLDLNKIKSSEHSWSQEGCHLVNSSDLHIFCQCNHLTTFGVLMRIEDVSEVSPKALELLTYICCCLSLACLFVVFVVFITLKNVLADQFIIHRNLVGALFTAQLLYVAGIDATSNKIVCRIIAVTLHYFYTVSFCWMLIEGMNLCFMLVKVFDNNDRFPHYYLFGWGFPVIIVGTSVSIACNEYGTENYCWLSTDIIWFFIGPAIVIILVNIGILVSVIKIIVQASSNLPKVKKASVSKIRLNTIRSGIKGTIILLPILGTTWIFGIVLLNSSLIVFEYIFAIFNGLQGVFIFIFYCLLNSEVQGAVRLKWMQASSSISPLVILRKLNCMARTHSKFR